MPDFVRVKQAETGHELTVPREHFEAVPKDAYVLLDKPAVDAAGTPLPAKHRTSVSHEAAKKQTGQTAVSLDKEI